MTDPTERNETVWDNSMDHDPHHGDEEADEDRHFRIPSNFRFGRWANGVLPYVITGSFTNTERTNIARVSDIAQE